jgi:PAS domain S-box-containing protein
VPTVAHERILIVEDEGIVAADLETTIKQLGYRVVGAATTGEEAIDTAERTDPDLVLMDIRLKGDMDGIEAAEQIIARLDIPVTYLTAYADSDTLGRAKLTLPYGYVLKPFEEKDLQTAIELALYKHRMERMMASLEGWHAAALRSLPDAIVALDTHERITFMNEAAESLFGWPLQDVYGKPLRDYISTQSQFAEVLKQTIPSHMEGRASLRSRAGKDRESFFRASPLKDNTGQETGIVIVFDPARQGLKLSSAV